MIRTMTLAAAACAWWAAGCSQPDADAFRDAAARYELARLPQIAAGPEAPGARARTDAVDGEAAWLGVHERLADVAPEADEGAQPATAPRGYVHWSRRKGPAYPGDFWHSVGRDAKELPLTLWDDTKATFTNPFSLGMLAAAGAAGIALSGDRGNDQVERHFTRNGSQLNTDWDSVGGFFGSPAVHFPAAGVMYVTTLAAGDVENYEKSKTLLNALIINGLTTSALKVMARTESPNGDEFGWPSGHTSSSFTLATVLYEEYGPWVGVPMFGFAAFVGYERVDARNHDFADVISGAMIGIAIGHAVSRNHQARLLGMEVVPFADPKSGAVGVALRKEW